MAYPPMILRCRLLFFLFFLHFLSLSSLLPRASWSHDSHDGSISMYRWVGVVFCFSFNERLVHLSWVALLCLVYERVLL